MIYDIKEFSPGPLRPNGTSMEISPGANCGVYEILNGAGTGRIGWLVEIAGTNLTSSTNYTWYANQAYFFWTSGSSFPSGFRLRLYAFGALPTWDPATADQTTTSGPFDTTATQTPVSGGSWWTIAKNATAVGYLNLQSTGTQNWYETAPNDYLTIQGQDVLIFNDTTTVPTTAMYLAVATLLADEVVAARSKPSAHATSR